MGRNRARSPHERSPKTSTRPNFSGFKPNSSRLQEWARETGARIVIVFEGRDAAGKGGTIKRITEYLSPRVAQIAALPAPTERERGQWYYQRYVAHLRLTTTQRYLHPDRQSVTDAGALLARHLGSQNSRKLPAARMFAVHRDTVSCNFRKALGVNPFAAFYWRSGRRIPSVRYSSHGHPTVLDPTQDLHCVWEHNLRSEFSAADWPSAVSVWVGDRCRDCGLCDPRVRVCRRLVPDDHDDLDGRFPRGSPAVHGGRDFFTIALILMGVGTALYTFGILLEGRLDPDTILIVLGTSAQLRSVRSHVDPGPMTGVNA